MTPQKGVLMSVNVRHARAGFIAPPACILLLAFLLGSGGIAVANPYSGTTHTGLTEIRTAVSKTGTMLQLRFSNDNFSYTVPPTNGKPFIIRLYRTNVAVPPLVRGGGLEVSTVTAGNTAELAISGARPVIAQLRRGHHELSLLVSDVAPQARSARVFTVPSSGLIRRDGKHAIRALFFQQEAHARFVREQRARANDQWGYDRDPRVLSERTQPYVRAGGSTVNAVVVELAAVGTTKMSPVVRTRVYTYIFDRHGGNLLEFSVRNATALQARAARLPMKSGGSTH